MRVEGQAQRGVEDDSQKRAAARKSAAVSEKGIVGEDGIDAGNQSVGRVAHAVDFGL